MPQPRTSPRAETFLGDAVPFKDEMGRAELAQMLAHCQTRLTAADDNVCSSKDISASFLAL